jgi:hypothetical protein
MRLVAGADGTLSASRRAIDLDPARPSSLVGQLTAYIKFEPDGQRRPQMAVIPCPTGSIFPLSKDPIEMASS